MWSHSPVPVARVVLPVVTIMVPAARVVLPVMIIMVRAVPVAMVETAVPVISQ
jgi:hypothetical protein